MIDLQALAAQHYEALEPGFSRDVFEREFVRRARPLIEQRAQERLARLEQFYQDVEPNYIDPSVAGNFIEIFARDETASQEALDQALAAVAATIRLVPVAEVPDASAQLQQRVQNAVRGLWHELAAQGIDTTTLLPVDEIVVNSTPLGVDVEFFATPAPKAKKGRRKSHVVRGIETPEGEIVEISEEAGG